MYSGERSETMDTKTFHKTRGSRFLPSCVIRLAHWFARNDCIYRHVSSHLILPHIASFEECQSTAFPSRLNFESNFYDFVSRGKKKKIRNLGNFELPPREEASIFQKFLSSRRCTHPSSPISNHVGRCGTMSIVLHCRARLKRNQT